MAVQPDLPLPPPPTTLPTQLLIKKGIHSTASAQRLSPGLPHCWQTTNTSRPHQTRAPTRSSPSEMLPKGVPSCLSSKSNSESWPEGCSATSVCTLGGASRVSPSCSAFPTSDTEVGQRGGTQRERMGSPYRALLKNQSDPLCSLNLSKVLQY